MPASEARVAANRRNAEKSTGPKTAEGKARSRANSLKHGLSGAGVVLADDDADEVARRFDDLQAEFAPSGTMGLILVKRIALESVRLDRCAEHETASTARRVRHAEDDHDEARLAEVSTLLDGLADDPSSSVRKLIRTPEGIDALVNAWLDLKGDLGRSNPRRWTAAHAERANQLTGRRLDAVTSSRIDELSNALWGDFKFLDDHEGQGLDDGDRQLWAGEQLAGFIDEEVATLRECREGLDLEAFELDRQEAGGRALFDPSKEATLARRYEAAAERTLFRSLRELRQVEREAAERPPVPQPTAVLSMGSFRAEPAPVAEEAETVEETPESTPEPAPEGRPIRRSRPESEDRDDSRPILDETEGVVVVPGWPSVPLLPD